MPDEILRIGAEFDAGPVIAGTRAATAAVTDLGDKVREQAAKFVASGLSIKDASAALINLGYSQEQVNAVMGAAPAVIERSTVAMSSYRGAVAQARVEAAALTNSSGMMASSFARLAAQSSTLGPLIAASFPIFAAIALVEVLSVLHEKYIEFEQSELRAAEAQHKVNEVIGKQEDEIRKLNEQLTGLTQGSLAEYALKMKDAAKASVDFSSVTSELVKSLKDQDNWWISLKVHVSDYIDQVTTAASKRGIDVNIAEVQTNRAGSVRDIEDFIRLTDTQINTVGDLGKAYESVGKKIQEVQAAYDARQKAVMNADEQAMELQVLRAEQTIIANRQVIEQKTELVDRAEMQKKAEEELLKVLQQQISANKEIVSSSSRTREAQALQAGGGYLSPDAKAELEKQAQTDLYNVEANGILQRLAIIQKFGQTYEGETAELYSKLETLATVHGNRLAEISAKYATEDLKNIQKEAEEVARYASEQEAKSVEERERGLSKELEDEEKAARARIAIINREAQDREALEEKQNRFGLVSGTGADALQKETALIQTLIAAEERYQQTVAATNLDEQKKDELTQASIARQITLQDQLTAAVERYQHTLSHLAEIEEQQIKSLAQHWTQSFTQMFNQVITGHEKVSTAIVQMMGKIELSMIDQGISVIVKKYAMQLLELIAAHSNFFASVLGITTAGNAAQKAQDTAAATSAISAKAAEAGAGAYAAAMIAIPFPEDLAAAPAAAATAVSEVESMLGLVAFEKGGIVPETGLAMVHAKEMVLPAPISTGLQGVFSAGGSLAAGTAAGASAGAGSAATHIHAPIHLHANGVDPRDVFGMKDELANAIKQAIRQGRIAA